MAEKEDSDTWVVRRFTIPGRILFLLTIFGSGALFLWYLMATLPTFPAGSYPIMFWLIPVGLAGFFFFLLAALVLEKLGVKIYRDPDP